MWDALCGGRYPVLGCLRCEPWAGYIASVCQVLMRTPAVAAWLGVHVAQCQSRLDGGGQDCVVCVLADSRACLGRVTAPPAVVHRTLAGPTFADTQQHGAAEFVAALLHAARGVELCAGRSAEWTADELREPRATLVDELFGLVLERCSRCSVLSSLCEFRMPAHVDAVGTRDG